MRQSKVAVQMTLKPKLKIAVIFDQAPRDGGAFHQSINTIALLKKACGGLFDIEIYCTQSEAILNEIGIRSKPLHQTMMSRIVEAALRSNFNSVLRRFNIMSPREKYLISEGVDLIYFPSHSLFALALRRLRFVLTIYDLAYRDFPEFPESVFEARESYNQRTVMKAVLAIVDSEQLKLKLQHVYGLADDRILAVPFTVTDYVQAEQSATSFEKFHLENRYLFYPAQFWAHKNHVRVLQALQILKQRGQVVDVAFAGSDKGGQAHVRQTALELGVIDQVHFLGFVASEDLACLYRNSSALIMPTYFGPTNLPPLEAWALGVPVIYSNHLSAGIEDGVLPVDPDVPESIAEAIEKVMQEDVRQSLIVGGRRCLAQLDLEIAKSAEALRNSLVRFARRKETWASF
jgi:glycosyltransferase involved in cell wall biosynthesis